MSNYDVYTALKKCDYTIKMLENLANKLKEDRKKLKEDRKKSLSLWMRMKCFLKNLRNASQPINKEHARICLDVLIARDEIQRLLAEQSAITKQALLELSSLDDRLKQQKSVITRTVPLKQWQQMVKPPDSAWWWKLEGAHPWNKFDWFWEVLTVPVLTLNFALVAAISVRFLAGGPDALGALAVIGQSVIAMFAAGAPLAKAGHQVIGRSLTSLRLPKYLWHEVKLVIAVIALILSWGLYSSLPKVSRYYVNKGSKAREAHRVTNALLDYKRAIELDPNNLEAHFRLGEIYEKLQDLEQAQFEYRIAMLGGCIEAYNNLARFYIVNEQDYSAAAALLTEGQFRLENRDSIGVTYCSEAKPEALEYAFAKNKGWARLEQGRLTEAESQLRTAIELNEQRAAPHCLLAQVLPQESDEEKSVVKQEWENCRALARGLNPDEDQWLNMAEQWLSQFASDEPEATSQGNTP